ncbi:MAG: type II toxin-antitoxin system VapC family toxin [Bacteroidetes bacterium]|nr:type II toxin-antitoxin system VapC family toxin [Bacteroidota bacterium]
MGQKYLLDTNVVIDFMGRKLPENAKVFLSEIIDDQINISAINKMELLGFNSVEPNLIAFVNFSEIYHIDDEVINKTIELRKKYKIKLPDTIIAATAIVNDFILVSHNFKDFETIQELQFIDPYSI